jgi:ABC-type sugar transport system ATPase subunit
MQDTLLSLQHISKNFGEGDVLRDISLDVARGEFVTLLGASGCGKTTTLRIISGLETPDEGTVLLDGRNVTALPPERRPVNTVFQSYALFPHMNVEKNVAYGLRVRRMDKASIEKRVREMLELVQMADFAKRMPSQLSGGQRQRIAIARALAPEPELLLLDEPLGALDLQLRRQMQLELKRLQKKLGITFVYITHDQEEAINMSDRIAVMRGGRFEQLGTPEEIFAGDYVQKLYGVAKENFDPLTGQVFFPKNAQAPKVFVIGGGGAGIPVYHCLQRQNIPFAAGILQENDVEFAAAKAMAVQLVWERAFYPIDEKKVWEAKKIMDSCSKCICAVEQFGPLNEANRQLAEYAKGLQFL